MSSNWAQTAVVAFAAASLSGLILLRILDEREKRGERGYGYHHHYDIHPHHSDTPPSPREKGSRRDAMRKEVSFKSLVPDDEGFVRGWSMEEAMAQAKEDSDKAKAKPPSTVLQSLQKGNSRFWTGKATRPEVSAFERRALINSQFPSTAILGCSDSRVPVEIVFDQGLGDMFVIRVAGNCLGPTTEASLEYAVQHLNVKVLLVMGHEGCGAIRAARLPVADIEKETKSLSNVLKGIKGSLDEPRLCQIIDPRARDRESVVMNVRNQVLNLTKEDHIMKKINAGNLILVGAFYEISSGIVDFFMEVSKNTGGVFKPSPGVQSRYNPKTEEVVYA